MNAYLFLFGAILFEVSGTLLLPLSKNFKKVLPSGGLVLCYLLSFYLLTHAVKELPLAVVYATWSGLGIALVTVLGIFLYRQNLPWQGFAGLVLIIIGVTLLNAYLPKTT